MTFLRCSWWTDTSIEMSMSSLTLSESEFNSYWFYKAEFAWLSVWLFRLCYSAFRSPATYNLGYSLIWAISCYCCSDYPFVSIFLESYCVVRSVLKLNKNSLVFWRTEMLFNWLLDLIVEIYSLEPKISGILPDTLLREKRALKLLPDYCLRVGSSTNWITGGRLFS